VNGGRKFLSFRPLPPAVRSPAVAQHKTTLLSIAFKEASKEESVTGTSSPTAEDMGGLYSEETVGKVMKAWGGPCFEKGGEKSKELMKCLSIQSKENKRRKAGGAPD